MAKILPRRGAHGPRPVALEDRELTPARQAILDTIERLSADPGTVSSQAEIARALGISRQNVSIQIKVLRAMGLVKGTRILSLDKPVVK